MDNLEFTSGGLMHSLFIFLLIAIPLTFIIAVWKRGDLSQGSKIMWTIFFVLAPVFSIICYLIFGYKPSSKG